MRRLNLAFTLAICIAPLVLSAEERIGAVQSARAARQGYAEVDGARLFYEIVGSGETVVLIHGGWGDIRYWEDQVAALADHFRVLRYDVRGFGKSSLPEEGRPYSDHEDLAALLDYLEIKNEHLVGFSMGARIALDYALAYPSRSKSLVTVGPVVSGFSSPSWEKWVSEHYLTISSVLKEKGREAAADYTIDVAFKNSGGDSATISRVREIVRDYPFWRYEHDSPRKGLQPAAVGRVESIQIPTLAVTAERDLLFCQEAADHLKNTIPGAQKSVLATAGHFMMMERPQEFNEVLVDFLNRQ